MWYLFKGSLRQNSGGRENRREIRQTDRQTDVVLLTTIGAINNFTSSYACGYQLLQKTALSSSRTRAKAVWSWWRWRWWWWWFEAPLSPKLQTALARFLDELQSLVKTRSSALGTSDPIWGPHPYFCGWKEELGRIRLLDQVNFEVWVV